MPVYETLLVFIGIPAAIVAVLAVLCFGGAVRQPNRYRPGRPWNFEPTWYVPHPDAVVNTRGVTTRAIEGASSSTTAVGGASGEW